MQIYYNKVNIFTFPCINEEGGSENMLANKPRGPVVCKVGFLQGEESSYKSYQQYYEWLREKISVDKMEVELKELVYLQSTYDRLYRQAVEELAPKKKKVQLCAIQARSESRDKLRQFIDKSEWLYNIATRYDNSDGYRYYDRMGSWYNAQMRTTMRLLENVSKLAKEDNDVKMESVHCANDEWNENKIVHVQVMKNRQIVCMFLEKE